MVISWNWWEPKTTSHPCGFASSRIGSRERPGIAGGLAFRPAQSRIVGAMSVQLTSASLVNPRRFCVCDAMISGRCADVGKFKGPILRGLAARAPYFHNGSAATLEDVVEFYDHRFSIGLTAQEKADLAAFLEASRTAAAMDLGRTVSALGSRKAGVEVLPIEGEPFEVLPAYAETHNIDLVVMGTVARTGLAGFVMGNTAERILSRLRGSVLAVKPAGFVSPVKA